MKKQLTGRAVQEKSIALEIAKKNGWETSKVLEDGSYAELQKVTEDGTPIYYRTFNTSAAVSTRTNLLNSQGGLGLSLDGQNMIAYVWDGGHGGVTHPEFVDANGNSRLIPKDTVSEGGFWFNPHANHVSGTMAATGVIPEAKGMAPMAQVYSYRWNNDLAEATEAAMEGMLISNHSYGWLAYALDPLYFGGYVYESKMWDELQYNAPYYLMVVAAGNDGDENHQNEQPLEGKSSYDKLISFATIKNNLVVGSIVDLEVDTHGNVVNPAMITDFSSQGPTDDYRIKPDIVGNGFEVYSPYREIGTYIYNTLSGTSMASPNVSGSLLLLQQYHEELYGNFMKAATIKGLALHTADDLGPEGPDAVYGWGVLNAKAVAESISNNGGKSEIQELSLSNGETKSFTVKSDGISPLVASISWTDPSGKVQTVTNDGTPVLVNDLDITISKDGTTYRPYRLTGVDSNGRGDNTVDPFERVDIGNASGTYTITVTHKGTLTDGKQDYSLVVTGLNGASEICVATPPAGMEANDIDGTNATISWSSVPFTRYELRYRELGAGQWTTESITGNLISIHGLLPNTAYETQVKSFCLAGSASGYSSSFTFTTTEITYCNFSTTDVVLAEEYISRVELGSINNSTVLGGIYSDHTSISTNLSAGSSHTISVTPSWVSSIYEEGYAVRIDYNQNGSFDDEGELVWQQNPTKTSPVSGTFTVPSSAKEGATRMRVSMKFFEVPTACEENEGQYYGEIEDYTVNIINNIGDNQSPTIPTGLTASNNTSMSVDLSWEASSDNFGVKGYEILRDGTSIMRTSGTAVTVLGLSPSTSYTFSLRAFDASGNNSGYISILNVTTLSGNPIVTMQKAGSGGFSMASDDGGDYRQDVYLSAYDPTDVNQLWEEIDRGGGYYSYHKVNTNHCIDGKNGGAEGQNVYLWPCRSAVQNQQWKKIDVGNGTYRLEKRNASGFSIDGNNGGEEGQSVYLWNSSNSNPNQQWVFTVVGSSADPTFASREAEEYMEENILLSPNPANSLLNVEILDGGVDEVIITSPKGNIVKTMTSLDRKSSIDVSELKPGIYFAKFVTDGKVVTKRFAKQ